MKMGSEWLDPYDEACPPAFGDAAARCVEMGIGSFEVRLPTERLSTVATIRSNGKYAPVNLMQDEQRIIEIVVSHVRYLGGIGTASIVSDAVSEIFQATGECVCGRTLTKYSRESQHAVDAGAQAFRCGSDAERHTPGCVVVAGLRMRLEC